MRTLALILALTAVSLSAQAKGPVLKTTPAPAAAPSSRSQLASSTSFWEDLGHRTDFNYFGQFNGPAFGRPLIENHNVFEEGPWPIYLYHEATLAFHPAPDFKFGMGLAATQDLAEGVNNRWGTPVKPSFTVFHPRVFASHQRIFDTGWLRLAGELSVLLPTSDYAQQERVFAGVSFNQTWNIRVPRGWTLNFTTQVQPTFYQYELPIDYDGFQRETLFVAAGHYLSYQFNRNFELSTSSIFDARHMSNAPGGIWDFGSAAEDRLKIQLDYYHGSGIFRLGAFVQNVIARPRLDTSIVGANLTINFLRSRY
jgi:hypothetical protein